MTSISIIENKISQIKKYQKIIKRLSKVDYNIVYDVLNNKVEDIDKFVKIIERKILK
jgi:hypothetical protein